MNRNTLITTVMLAGMASTALGDEQDIHFSSIVGSSELIVINNAGEEPVSLDGWRFCTQSSTSGPVFSAPGGLDGVVVPGRRSIIIRYANDALPTFPTHHNASDVGPLAPFDLDAYAMSLYFPDASGEVDFNNPDQMAKHIQWKRAFVDSDFSTFAGPIAQGAGIWEDAASWITVRLHLYLIEHFDRDPAMADGPADYNVLHDCQADLSDDGLIDFFDVSVFIAAFNAQLPAADFTRDGNWDFFDVSVFLSNYQRGECPNF